MPRDTPQANTSLPAVRPGFVAAYMAAQVGAYIAFIPLLTILLPLKAAAIDPEGRAEVLSQAALWGAMTAGLAGVVAGMIGDRSRHWPGGRSLWLIGGLIGTVFSYVLIHRAATAPSLIAAIIVLQISLNFMLNPLAAVLPERVPAHQRGMVAGFTGLAYPLSNLFGAVAIGLWLTVEIDRLVAVVAVTVAMVLPFIATTVRAPSLGGVRTGRSVSFTALADRDFLLAFASRLLVQTAVAMNVLYLLFFLDQDTNIARVLPSVRIEMVAGGLLIVSTGLAVVAGLVGGRLSDRIGKRRRIVFTGAALLAAGTLLMAAFPQWPGPLIAQAVFGIGVGMYGITEAVLAAEVLPSPEDAGRDLGLMNVASTAAQMLAPALALAALAWWSEDLRIVYLAGSALAMLGGFLVLGLSRVR
ncbi:MAG: MFS transporter [Brevundimonas sp.]|uniref:MFS transporter n=1 Tax=Brevundimonas sp. TaxID=1871086 RepID=UPI001A17F659|nr:MFS transporter [Brevundimonas sp.]MBJ7446522.1 MFS transporter [Brevundimonas sp.]